jgi:phosphoribosylanthranilate isomerase
MTAVKFCGIMRPEDAAAAADLGADLIGMVFAGASRRRVTLERAVEIASASGNTPRVGVFKWETLADILAAVERARLSFVQMQRAVSAEDVEALPVPVIAAVRRATDAEGLPDRLVSRLRAVLLDDSEGLGTRSGWESLAAKPSLSVDVFLAGGLDADCVGDVIRRLRPDGVDVASGIESDLGVKDPHRMKRFLSAVREADRAAL